MSRRGESIYKRTDGRWEARYIHHYENGRAKYRYLYASSYGEVKAKRLEEQQLHGELHLLRGGTESGTERVSGRIGRQEFLCQRECAGKNSFEEMASAWLLDVRERVKASTYAQYVRVVRRYLQPHLGNRPLSEVNVDLCTQMGRALAQGGRKDGTPLSNKTIADILCVCKAIFGYGRAHGYPCADLSPLERYKWRRGAAPILTEQNRRTIEEAFQKASPEDFDYRVRLGTMVALYTGLRIGELCGMQYGDMDVAERTIRVCRTIQRIQEVDRSMTSRTRVVLGPPKSELSARIIPLPSFLVTYLLKDDQDPACYLLTGTRTPTEPHQFYLRYKTFMRRHGMGHFTFHALRHTFATRCVEEGFDIKSLAEILGHANISTTLSLYVHPTLEQKRRQMERLQPQCDL